MGHLTEKAPGQQSLHDVQDLPSSCGCTYRVTTVEPMEVISSTKREPPVRSTGTPSSPGQSSTGTSYYPHKHTKGVGFEYRGR